MCTGIKKTILFYLFLGAIFSILPVMSWSMLVVQTEVVSGNISNKFADHSIKLDNEKIYRPSRKGLVLDLPVGEPVTLRYMVEDSKNVFFEFAPGLNSLKELEPVHSLKDNIPK